MQSVKRPPIKIGREPADVVFIFDYAASGSLFRHEGEKRMSFPAKNLICAAASS